MQVIYNDISFKYTNVYKLISQRIVDVMIQKRFKLHTTICRESKAPYDDLFDVHIGFTIFIFIYMYI